MLFTETVVLKLPGGPTGEYDDLGNEIIAPGTDEVWPAWYEIGSSTESTDAREQQVWGYTLYLPHGAPLGAASAATIEGGDYEVIGGPGGQPGGVSGGGCVRAGAREGAGVGVRGAQYSREWGWW